MRIRPLLLVLALGIALASPTAAQTDDGTWDTYSSAEFNVQFDVPAGWKVEHLRDSDVPGLIAYSEDRGITLVVLAYKDRSIGTEALLDEAVDLLDMDLAGEAAQEELNGFDAWIAEAEGFIDDVEVGLFILAATYDDNNYVAYIFTPIDGFDENAEVMNDILDSFSPLNP